jgi:hypothetical protein
MYIYKLLVKSIKSDFVSDDTVEVPNELSQESDKDFILYLLVYCSTLVIS